VLAGADAGFQAFRPHDNPVAIGGIAAMALIVFCRS